MATDGTFRGESRSSIEPAVGTGNRIASAIVGGALLLVGLRRRSLGGVLAAIAGGLLLYRGVTGGRSRNQSKTSGSHLTGASHSTDATHSTDGSASLDATDSTDAGASTGARSSKTAVERSVTVGKPVEGLYDRWTDPEQLNRVLGDAVEVTAEGDERQRWTVDGPLGRSVTWETRTVEDRPGEVLRWESVEDSRLSGRGEVRFQPAPGDRGTEVTLRLRFDPPGGRVGDAAMDRLGFVPETLVSTALDRFKSLAETGETPTLDRNPSARGQGDFV
jgi:uncharacterized membrane protein